MFCCRFLASSLSLVLFFPSFTFWFGLMLEAVKERGRYVLSCGSPLLPFLLVRFPIPPLSEEPGVECGGSGKESPEAARGEGIRGRVTCYLLGNLFGRLFLCRLCRQHFHAPFLAAPSSPSSQQGPAGVSLEPLQDRGWLCLRLVSVGVPRCVKPVAVYFPCRARGFLMQGTVLALFVAVYCCHTLKL